ncbi:helix-turn-helix domain-containing protein [Paenibacillus mesophilus]|uniref:helix-turn-helix domain-containing protein n=1 Tax=Paenibacillus mesophilus TaxID=2582849 RepID=UPI00110DB274|nr:AraC family transcriptional regulator [Paenibacillus mesophilus]TMV48658.1 helix-turn-helix domain-containing protein [Paenibacillus mesophilus]
MELAMKKMDRVIEIDNIVTFHYRELPKQFSTIGQSYPYWEMVYVDKGEFAAVSDTGSVQLKQGDTVFYPPGERHGGTAHVRIPPNLLIVGFECASEAMNDLLRTPFRLGDAERRLLTDIVREGLYHLEPVVPLRRQESAVRQSRSSIGQEQLVRNQLEILFIRLLRKNAPTEAGGKLSSVQKEHQETDIAQKIVDYIERTDISELCLDRICRTFALSRTHLGAIFKRSTGCSVMEYVRKLKIAKAKALIREETYNYSEIAELLGYCSIHYFSKDFKKWTGTAPSEYAKSVIARI